MELCKKNKKLDIQKAEVKVKLVTDTYMLQYHQDYYPFSFLLSSFSRLQNVKTNRNK
jgi:hypothetical protein